MNFYRSNKFFISVLILSASCRYKDVLCAARFIAKRELHYRCKFLINSFIFDTHLITLAVISNIFTCLLIKLYYQKKDLKSPTQYNVFFRFSNNILCFECTFVFQLLKKIRLCKISVIFIIVFTKGLVDIGMRNLKVELHYRKDKSSMTQFPWQIASREMCLSISRNMK